MTARRLTGPRLTGLLLALSVSTSLAILAALHWGAGDSGLADLLANGSEQGREILLRVRLPRVLLAALLGAALALAGSGFQALLRNPLADPYVLGVSGGASLGGVVALVAGLGAAGWGAVAVPLCALGGALVALRLLIGVASVGGRLAVYTVLLTGAILNAFSAAVIYFVQSVVSQRELHQIVFYLMGRIGTLSPGHLALVAAMLFAAALPLVLSGRALNALALGEDEAARLGVAVEPLKRRVLVTGAVLTAVAVAVGGMIGFVGLVVPHALRLTLGADHRLLLPASLLGGAGFLVLGDLAARVAFAPVELPVGVLTAMIGGPFFIVLLRRGVRRRG